MLFDDDFMCTLCDGRFESELEYANHLRMQHGQMTGSYHGAVHSHTNQPAQPAFYSNDAVNVLSSPFVPRPRQPQAQVQAAAFHGSFNWYSVPRHAAPAYTTSPSTHALLTPPNSRGTPSPLPSAPQAVRTSVQKHTTQYPTPQHTFSLGPVQQYGGQRAYPKAMSNGNAAPLPPFQQERQQQTQRPHSNTPATARQTTPKLSFVPKKKSTSKKQPSTTRRCAVTLGTDLPPLPQAIYDLGLTEADFDPSIDYGKRTLASRYVDIPDSVNLADQHMFNANDSTILGYGNLLRLAARFTETEVYQKLNANRPKDGKGDGPISKALISRRLQAATKWAAGRPEWQRVGDVQAWLVEKQLKRQNELYRVARKRKTDTDDDVSEVTYSCAAGSTVAWAGTEYSHLSTPPSTKRMRSDTSSTSGQLSDPETPMILKDAAKATSTWQGHGHSTPYGQGDDIASEPTLAIYTPESMPSPSLTTQPGAPKLDGTVTTQLTSTPTPAPASAPAAVLQSVDFQELTETIGADSALALVAALGIPENSLPPVAFAKSSEAPPEVITAPKGNFDDLFSEFLSHPEHFMGPQELAMGERFAKIIQTTREMGASQFW